MPVYRDTAHFCQPRSLMQCWRTILRCTCHDATHWFYSILQPQSRSLCCSWTFQDRHCHTTASALQTDRQVPEQAVFFAILCENNSLFSKVSWNIFYSIVASLAKRAQLDLSLDKCLLCGNYCPALKWPSEVGHAQICCKNVRWVRSTALLSM